MMSEENRDATEPERLARAIEEYWKQREIIAPRFDEPIEHFYLRHDNLKKSIKEKFGFDEERILAEYRPKLIIHPCNTPSFGGHQRILAGEGYHIY